MLPSNWITASLGEVVKFASGGTPSRENASYWNGDIPWFSAKDLKKFQLLDSEEHITESGSRNGTRIIEPNTILILVRGMTLLKSFPVGMTTRRSAFNQDLRAVIPNDCLDREFLAYWLTANESKVMALVDQAGHGTGRLATDRLADLDISFPSNLFEQQAIAHVLSAWDRGIRQLSDLIAAKLRFKQGLMQQLLTGRRRFPGFSQSTETHHTPCGELPIEWKMNPLSHITRELKRKNDQGVTRVLTASGNRGLVDQREFFNRKVAGEALDKYYLLLHGEFAYNRSLMRGYPYGATKRLDDYDCGVLSTLYLCFQLISDECISDFLVLLFESGLLNSQLRGIARMGARVHGLLNVTADEFFDMVVPLPQREEQQRIVEIFGAIDRELGLLRKELDALKTQKKGLMQKLLTGQVRVKVPPELKQ